VDRHEEQLKITTDPDYICLPKYENSLKIFLSTHPNGTSDSMICKALCISQKELDELYQSAILKLKDGIVIDE
jgi:hypothetical protein